MKNQEQVQWSVLLDSAELLRLVLEIRSGIPQELVDLLLFLGAALVGESTSCCIIPGILKFYHNQCKIMSMVDNILCLFGRYHSNR